MRAVVAMLLLVACARPPAPASSTRSAPEPMQLVREVLAAYIDAKSYEDTGTVEVDERGVTSTVTFTTKRSGDSLSLELVGPTTFHFSLDHRGPLIESSLTPGRVARRFLEGSALAASPSRSVPRFVPYLLLAAQSPLISASSDVGSSEVVAGHRCWRLDGAGADASTSIWIDVDTRLVRRLVFDDRHGRRETVNYEPLAGSEVVVTGIDTSEKVVVDESKPHWIGIRFDGDSSRVLAVIPGGPAQKAGMQAGDEIIELEGDLVNAAVNVTGVVRGSKVGEPLRFAVHRGGKRVKLEISPAEMPDLDTLANATLVGKPAPDFALRLVNGSGEWAKLENYSVVVLDFWATWCRPCEMMIPHLHELRRKYGSKLDIVAISSEGPAVVSAYIQQHKLRYPVALDADGVVSGNYLAQVLPTTIVVAKGIVRYVKTGVGDETDFDAAIAKALASP